MRARSEKVLEAGHADCNRRPLLWQTVALTLRHATRQRSKKLPGAQRGGNTRYFVVWHDRAEGQLSQPQPQPVTPLRLSAIILPAMAAMMPKTAAAMSIVGRFCCIHVNMSNFLSGWMRRGQDAFPHLRPLRETRCYVLADTDDCEPLAAFWAGRNSRNSSAASSRMAMAVATEKPPPLNSVPNWNTIIATI